MMSVTLKTWVAGLEKDVLDFLILIRSKQEKAGEQRAEQLGKAQPTNSADPKGRAAD